MDNKKTGDTKFEKSLIAAGFGGQGLMVLGQLVAYTGIEEGRFVSWIPSYGPEMRGGTANCCVIVSSEEIGAPVVSEADVIVVMNQPSFEKFKNDVKEGGLLLYNSDLVKADGVRPNVRTVGVPVNTIAREAGSEKVANIVMLGAVVAASGIVGDKTCVETLKEKLGKKKPEYLPMNLAAYERGKAIVH
ncbi:MAG: 2-oxoacid:acceptor oxidoreductase family protein [Synergistaceae bacterium]|jgi:2-oxoglutarate ferredoxin oxidoreductase subunit gamma|nr:2-oxoacid:acceptor oxidoreductase family protein [Synergistaceae bacterium]